MCDSRGKNLKISGPSRIELEYQVQGLAFYPLYYEAKLIIQALRTIPVRLASAGRSIVLRDQSGKTTGKNFGTGQVSNCNSVFLDVNFFRARAKNNPGKSQTKPAITSDA